jgi:asparagine synthase (glutamine-hydrolysing)
MGGILFMIYDKFSINKDFFKSFSNMSSRGTDNTSFFSDTTDNITNLSAHQDQMVKSVLSRSEIKNYKQLTFLYAYQRSAINDMSYDAIQPFEDPILHKIYTYPELRSRPQRKMMCNGEIYNYKEIISKNNFTDKDIQSNSDCEVILPLYIKYNESETVTAEQAFVKTLNDLEGDYAIVLTENVKTFELKKINTFVARDFLGIKPLYYISKTSNDQNVHLFVSEIKAVPKTILQDLSYSIIQVPPGTYWSFQNPTKFVKYYSLDNYKNLENCVINKTDPDTLLSVYTNIQDIITNSVINKYITAEVQTGILLSGGFDSSIITTIIARYLNNKTNATLELFTIGDTQEQDDLDVKYAKEFVQFLRDQYTNVNIRHHIIYINDLDIIINDIDKIIYRLETYDPETIREAIPYYYLFKYISEKTNVKVLLSGDGLDEFCGYPEFQNLDDTTFQEKSVELLDNLCNFDVLRSDRMSSTFSLEVRHPFLDKALVEYILSLHPKLKRWQAYKDTEAPIEKYIIRRSFDHNVDEKPIFLPDFILWRSCKCICNFLKNFENKLFNYMENYVDTYEYNLYRKKISNENQITLPKTKEEMFYRKIFDKYYPNRSYIVPLFWNNIFPEHYCN